MYRKSTLLIVISFITLVAVAHPGYKYRILLTDKNKTTFSLDKPDQFLSKKALERREKQNIKVDSTDLPICEVYVKAIERQGVKVVAKGKWNNFVTVSCIDTTRIDKIAQLPFVRSVKRVWIEPKEIEEEVLTRDTLINEYKEIDSLYYGVGTRQIEISQADKLHQQGFKGQGMEIAVIDAGFHNLDSILLLDNVKIGGVKDFVNPDGNLYLEHSHGLGVLSCMAANKPKVIVGTAPEATYWLLRSEDERTEHLVEQDYWSAAVEYADSVGVDVINTSLGYHAFDDETQNYTYRHLDGEYALISSQASMIAKKGMVLVCSAGNTGANSWKKITTPGDASSVLTVGAIDAEGVLAPFSAVGNTVDGRIKPDVVAVGRYAYVVSSYGTIVPANGTSFASPILCGMVACLWQALPHLSAEEIVTLVRQSGDRVLYPDNIYGYGIPDFWKAYQLGKE
ncbi:MAG: S8 family serine peptidase [Bacteroidales bacterium]|nr:S8 family serine peptidase [Bacteroidales bacterium]